MRKVFEPLLNNVDEFVVSPEGVLLYRIQPTLFSASPNSVVLEGVSPFTLNAFTLSNNGTLYACSFTGITVILNAIAQIKNNEKIKKQKHMMVGETRSISISPDNKKLVTAGTKLNIFTIADDGSLHLEKTFEHTLNPFLKALAISSEGDVATLTQNECLLYRRSNNYSFERCGAPTPIKNLAIDAHGWLHLLCERGIALKSTGPSETVSSYFSFNEEMLDFSLSADGFCYMVTKSHSGSRKLRVKSFVSDAESHGGFDSLESHFLDAPCSHMYPNNKQGIYLLKNGQMFLLEHQKSPSTQNVTAIDVPRFEDSITAHAAFIVQNYYLIPFANGQKRRTHGALHVCRAAILGTLFVNLYRRHQSPIFADINEHILKLIQIALLFHDAGREAEGEDLWDRASALLGYRYIRNILKLTIEDALLVADAIANKDSYKKAWILLADLTWTRSGKLSFSQRKSYHVAVHEGDCADNKRTKIGWHARYLDFVKYFLSDESFSIPTQARQDLMGVLDEVDQLLFLTGDSVWHPNSRTQDHYNARVDCFAALLEVMKKNNLNNLLALYADGKILTMQEAQALPIQPRLAQQESFFFKKYMPRDDYTFSDFLISLTRSPLNVDRRDLRIKREKKPIFSIRAHRVSSNSLRYEVQELGKNETLPMYTPEEKKGFSKPTGLCFAHPGQGFFPRVYADHERDEIGISFPRDSVLVNRIFGYNRTMSTYYRFYERESREEAEQLLSTLVQSKLIFNSLEALVQAGRNNKTYQVLGRLSYAKGIKILLFSARSEEAFKKAEIAAALLERRIEFWVIENQIKLPERVRIPIIYYLPTHILHLQPYSPQSKYFAEVCVEVSRAEKELSLVQKWSCTLLHLRAAHNNMPPPDVLLQKFGKSLDTADNRGRTALFYAAQNAHVWSMTQLILAGANFKFPDKEGKYFIDVLFQFGFFVAFASLLEKLDVHPEHQKNVRDLLVLDLQRVSMWKAKIARHEKKNPELQKLNIFN